jgi:hypothetical protein
MWERGLILLDAKTRSLQNDGESAVVKDSGWTSVCVDKSHWVRRVHHGVSPMQLAA